MRYRTRPVEVDAIQWTGDNLADVFAWAGYNANRQPNSGISIATTAGTVWGRLNDWIVRDDAGYLKCLSPAVFDRTYEPA